MSTYTGRPAGTAVHTIACSSRAARPPDPGPVPIRTGPVRPPPPWVRPLIVVVSHAVALGLLLLAYGYSWTLVL